MRRPRQAFYHDIPTTDGDEGAAGTNYDQTGNGYEPYGTAINKETLIRNQGGEDARCSVR